MNLSQKWFCTTDKKQNLIIFYGFLVIQEIRRGPLGPRSQNIHFSLYEQVDQLDPSGILVEWLIFFGILQPHHCHHSL